MPTRAATKKSGLTVQTFKGLNKARMAKQSGGANAGLRLQIKQGETIPVQFISKPEEFTEFEQHSWQDGGRWNYVPCMGETCPLCMDEDRQIAKKGYRFAVPVYNLKERKVQILEGPKDLAGRIFYRYERAPSKFLKRTYDVTKFPTTPVSYDFAIGEDDLVQTSSLKSIPDVEVYLENELKRYFGDEIPDTAAVTSKDEDEEDEEDEEELEEYTLSDLKKMKVAKLAEICEVLDIDPEGMDKSDMIDAIVEAQDEEGDEEDEDEDDEEEEDEDSEDEEEDEEDEDDEEDEEEDEDDEDEEEEEAPAPRKRPAAKKAAPAKKAPARKAPAKKAPASRKAPARRR